MINNYFRIHTFNMKFKTTRIITRFITNLIIGSISHAKLIKLAKISGADAVKLQSLPSSMTLNSKKNSLKSMKKKF